MMSPHIHNLYIDFFTGRHLRNEGEGLDIKGDPEYGIASRAKFPGMAMIYILRSK